MTAPFAPPPSRTIWLFVIGLAVVTLAMPFARREDATGWTAFLAIAGAVAFLWGTLIVGLVRNAFGRLRDET